MRFILLYIVHGWINGHKHVAELDADISEYYNLIKHLEEKIKLAGDEILLVLDSGDITQVNILF
jgi:hypothetical protein